MLACPQCERGLDLDDGVLLCEAGHSFDVARQGYVSLLTGAATRFTGDTAEMIAARADFLDAGHYDPLLAAVARSCAERPCGDGTARVLEVGAGTGRYLAAVLDALPGSRGVGLDVSKPAVRRIARSHPRVGAVLADVWRQLPIRSGVLSHVLSVFAPRNAAETHRVLAPGGVLVVAAPTPSHLRELVALPGMVQVDERKTERLGAALSGAFERVDRADVQFTLELDRPALGRLAGMGPSGHHLTAERLSELVAGLPEPFPVTASVTVTVWERRETH
nr:methyltransferase domain-containing protein [Rhodococcus sp. 14C212]